MQYTGIQMDKRVLPIDGTRISGSEVRQQNVTACVALANIVKTSLGPEGLDKMLVDQIGDVTITNDGATILSMLDVEHPAAKMLVSISNLQDEEVGDGTTSVVVIAAELLKRANELIKKKIHPTSVIAGYKVACREACKYINSSLTHKVSDLGESSIFNCAKTSMASKIISQQGDFFALMAVDAMKRVKNAAGKYPLKAINILKSHGKSAKESTFVKGFALNCTIASQQMPRSLKNVRIACIDFNLQRAKMVHGVKVIVSDPKKLEAIREKEKDIARDRVNLILKSGANVILTSKAMDDLCQKYLVEQGVIGVRRVDKSDLVYIAKSCGATVLTTLADFDSSESFSPDNLGFAESFSQERIGDNELCVIRGCKQSRTSSIILRGANEQMLDEMERSLHDVLCIVKRTLESESIVAGGGCVEASLSVHLRSFAHSLKTREQLAITQFAESLLTIPKTLSINAAHDAIDLTSHLVASHNKAQTDPKNSGEFLKYGIDLEKGVIRDNINAGVLEPTISKIKTLKFATEAAISILRIDELIKLDPPPQRSMPGRH